MSAIGRLPAPLRVVPARRGSRGGLHMAHIEISPHPAWENGRNLIGVGIRGDTDADVAEATALAREITDVLNAYWRAEQ
jgi:hypothetical protein